MGEKKGTFWVCRIGVLISEDKKPLYLSNRFDFSVTTDISKAERFTDSRGAEEAFDGGCVVEAICLSDGEVFEVPKRTEWDVYMVNSETSERRTVCTVELGKDDMVSFRFLVGSYGYSSEYAGYIKV